MNIDRQSVHKAQPADTSFHNIYVVGKQSLAVW